MSTILRCPGWGKDRLDVIEAGKVIGGVAFPFIAQAKNARLKYHQDASRGDAHLAIGDDKYRMRHEYLTREFSNDIRYTLETPDGKNIAVLDLLVQKGFKRPRVLLRSPIDAELIRQRIGMKLNINAFAEDGTQIGRIFEPALFSLKWQIAVDIALLPQSIRAFLGAVTFSAFY